MYSENEARQLVIEAGLRLVNEKLIARTWGNISARISDEEFVITPSGRTYESLKPEDLVKVKIGDLSYEGNIKPSSEKGLHASCYKNRKGCNFVIHTHQFYASAICAEERDTDFAPCAKYAFAGTTGLVNNVTSVVVRYHEYKCFLMAKHGAIILGDDYEDSFRLAQDLEVKCKKLFEENKHLPRKGSFIDDYAQMFDVHGNPNPGENPWAVEFVRSKNEAAASYANKDRPLDFFRRTLEHLVYTKKYSKQKELNK